MSKSPTKPVPRPLAYRRRLLALWLTVLGALALLASGRLNPRESPVQPLPRPSTVSDLLSLPGAALAGVPLEDMNLICAKGLSPTAEVDLDQCTATVDLWANHVRSETDRHLYRFQRNPAEFENSEGFYRMLMLCVVLEEDYGIHYDTSRTNAPHSTRPGDRFFSDPEVVFLHGLLGPRRLGTCSSLPVLYVAIGRKLGYPLKLVATKGHLFVRWESGGERFNVEATGHGLCRFDDDYYRHWPFKISVREENENQYLRSLTPPQELAAFLSIRGMCLVDSGRSAEAADAFAAATRLAPDCREYSNVIARLKLRLKQPQETSSAALRALYQTAQK